MIFIELSGKPTAKARARVYKRKNNKYGSYTPKKTKAYSNDLAGAAIDAMKGKKMLEGALVVNISCYMPIPKTLRKKVKAGDPHIKKPDLDNIIKQLDALNGIVYKDDSQLCFISAWKMYATEPRLEIIVQKHEGLLT
jgi:Holliday junction resolvase RusA-like endonuclease